MSHADAIDAVHGGIRGGEVVALLQEAERLGAQAYTIDRPYHETQNCVAKRLVLHPQELLAFVRHSAAVLAGGADGRSAAGSAQPCPAGVQDILAGERERLMAAEALRRAVPGAQALLFCTTERVSGLRDLLNSPGVPSSRAAGSSATRIWPFLLVFVYLVLPTYGSLLLAWRLSRTLADLISPSSALALPDGEPAVARPEAASAGSATPAGSRAQQSA